MNGLKPVVAGLAVGLLVASQLTRLLDSFLYGMSKSDPTTYVGTVAALFVAAVLACLIPALGATRTDPAEVLRSD